MELDIYIPSLNIGIEFDGKLYHKSIQNKSRDAKKYVRCKENGIFLIRISDTKDEQNFFGSSLNDCDCKIEIVNTKAKNLNQAICELFKILEHPIVPNIENDRHNILKYLTATDISLAESYPELSNEWNYNKNGELTPAMFHPGSCEKVWWLCKKCGHEWKTAICERTGHDKTSCPKCAKAQQGATKRENNLKTKGSFTKTHPEVLKEWDYERNLVAPESLVAGSTFKAWWICNKCDHRWQTTISHRTQRHSGCPCCSNRVIVSGKNDLATTHPNCISEWDYEKNTEVTPQNVSYGSNKKAWWKCSKCGYEYMASISSRASAEHCPQCIKKIKLKTFQETIVKKNGSFGEHCTHLLAEWDYDKN